MKSIANRTTISEGLELDGVKIYTEGLMKHVSKVAVISIWIGIEDDEWQAD